MFLRLKNIASRLRTVPALMLAGSLAVALLLVATRPEREPVRLPEKAWNVQAMPATTGDIRPTLELYGRIESPLDATLSVAVDADVLEVVVQDGQKVDAGQTLIVLDGRDAQLELLQREADVQEIQAQVSLERRRLIRNREALEKEQELLALAQKNEQRAISLFEDKLFSQANVDDAAEEFKRQQLAVTSRSLAIEESQFRVSQLQAQLRRAEALRDKAQLTVDRTLVAAPFAGLVSDVRVSQGDRVRVGDDLMRLHDPDALELRAQVPNRYAARIRDSLAAKIEMNADVEVDGETYQAALERISGQTREGSGSVETFLRFVKSPANARLGATVRLVLGLPAEAEAIAIPAEAIYGRNRIYKVVDGRMVGVVVERVGERALADGRSQVIIRSALLNEADQIITTKVSTATDGLLVRLIEPGTGNPASMAARDGVQPAQ